jgi:hypothetical protein
MPTVIRLLIFWNSVVTIVLTAVLFALFSHRNKVERANSPELVRTNRLEIVDRNGKVKAVMGTEGEALSSPKLTFYDQEGREAAIVTVNSSGYATMYFQDKRTEGKVSVGYLWGSDTLSTGEFEDPLASWGIRVRGRNLRQTSFGLLNNGEPIPQLK